MEPEQPTTDQQQTHRQRCYDCYRPTTQCFCDIIPRIENRTQILILQHTRERFHAFNTARIVNRSLVNSRVEVGFTPKLAQAQSLLTTGAGLLYPGENAKLIGDVPIADRPDQIVVLDGTWHHAKTMMRDIPWLRDLPQYRIDPANPSQYRIRREPTIEALSTVEATVDLLRSLEPNTDGLDDLLTAFNVMIDRHIAVIGTANPRHVAKPDHQNRIATNIPTALLGDANNIVIAYGESVPPGRERRHPSVPVFWVAQRLGTGEQFQTTIRPPRPIPASILAHMELTDADFANAIEPDQFSSAWQSFIHPTDTLVVYNKGARSLLKQVDADCTPCINLTSIDFRDVDQKGTLSDLLTALGVRRQPTPLPGRAGKRLANAIALVEFIRQSSALNG